MMESEKILNRAGKIDFGAGEQWNYAEAFNIVDQMGSEPEILDNGKTKFTFTDGSFLLFGENVVSAK